jgi:hypothetical protein
MPADAGEALAVEARITLLADGDLGRRDRQLRAVVNLLLGARNRAAERRQRPGNSR